jgi:hypothetical protein
MSTVLVNFYTKRDLHAISYAHVSMQNKLKRRKIINMSVSVYAAKIEEKSLGRSYCSTDYNK